MIQIKGKKKGKKKKKTPAIKESCRRKNGTQSFKKFMSLIQENDFFKQVVSACIPILVSMHGHPKPLAQTIVD